MKRALVLGGGGTVGIAWETGMAAALKDGGVDLSRADLIVGTSAGSVCGTHLAAGVDALTVLLAAAAQPHPEADALAEQNANFIAIYQRWSGMQEMTPETARELGAMALAAGTMPERAWLGTIAPLLGVADWPQTPLLLTAVNAETGEFRVWDRNSGVDIAAAVAASCAVPGIAPPVTINGHRYIDGGVHSVTNANLATGCDQVLIIAPIGPESGGLGAFATHHMQQEIAALRAGGSTVDLIQPDPETLAVFGANLMDAERVPLALQAGFRQGANAAALLARRWG